jgi:hypothetical protein
MIAMTASGHGPPSQLTEASDRCGSETGPLLRRAFGPAAFQGYQIRATDGPGESRVLGPSDQPYDQLPSRPCRVRRYVRRPRLSSTSAR